MTEGGRPITENELHAYVDGQLDPERRASVDRYLREQPEVARRVAAYGTQREELRAAFAARAAAPIPPSLDLARLIEERLTRRRAPWRLAASVALALGLGGAGGWYLGSRPPTGLDALAQEAGASYAVFAADERRPMGLWAEQRNDLTRWVSNRLNRPVSPPDLSMAGYRFLGGRLIATERGPAALFMYENESGARLVVFVRPMARGNATAIEPVEAGPVDGCAWIERGVGYTVVAAEPYDRLLELSRQVRQQAQAPG